MITLLVAVAPNGLMAGRDRHTDDLNGGVVWTSILAEAQTWASEAGALEYLDKHYPLVAAWVRDGSVRLQEAGR